MLVARTLTEWHVKPNSKFHRDIRSLGETVGTQAYVQRNPFFLAASLWLLSKYGLRKHIKLVIDQTFAVWSHSEFFSRQVAATYGKFRFHPEGEEMRRHIGKLKFFGADSVLDSFDRIARTGASDQNVRLYILNGRNISNYSISRFLTCLHVLTSPHIDPKKRRALRADVLLYVNDPLYVRVINKIRIR